MRKSLMMIGVVALALSLGLAQAKPTATSSPPVAPGFQLAGLTASNLDPNSGFCRKMDYYCMRGDQNACANYNRVCEPQD